MSDSTERPGDADALPCGRRTGDLLTQVAEGRGEDRDRHQRGCLHCQAVLGEYARLWTPWQELADTPVDPPVDLVRRTVAALRRPGAAPGRQARVADEDTSYRVTERAVVSVAGHVARTTPGVRMALGGLGGREDRRTAHVGVSGGSVAIDVVVAADYGRDLLRLAGEVRTRVHDAVRDLLGLEAVEIAVEIDDVLLPRDRAL